MTQAHERTATLSALVAEEIRALMARRRVSGRQLSAQLGVSPSWVSYRLTGTQPIDINDMHLIAGALGVGVHELLPPPEAAARAADPRTMTGSYAGPVSAPVHTTRPRDNRPARRPETSTPPSPGRTAYVERGGRRGRSR